MDINAFLEILRLRKDYRGQVIHVEQLPARPARFADLPDGAVDPRVTDALHSMGIDHLYTHQADSISHISEGRSVVVVTGTASGKTLCYTIPVVDALVNDVLATALFVYPTKALAQDQLRGLNRFAGESGSFGTELPKHPCPIKFVAGTYDGDTPATERRKLRDKGSVILTNPDMLHQGIIPQHARWNKFFSHLKYVVLDEVHSYRGVFGSHLANVIRRLKRICAHYGSDPQFICCSATIANPREHAERIAGVPMELVENDGSPRGPKRFVFWNPPQLAESPPHPNPLPPPGGRGSLAAPSPLGGRVGERGNVTAGGERRSSLWEAVELMSTLVKENVQTIAFVRTRLMAELIYHHAREYLGGISPKLARSVQAYRGGYLPEERREIERKLASGELLGVSSTNALELGIDIGTLDASILVGYPGTIASTWQQAGRAGRKGDESVVFFIAENSPIDQYLMSSSDYLFAQSPEQAVIDPDNPHVAIGHIKSATHELPLCDKEAELFGDYALPVLEILEEEGCVKHINGIWYWASTEYPAAGVNLRNISGPVYTIQDATNGNHVIGTMDEVSALAQLHTHAVYIHNAETYFVEFLDFDKKIAFVTKRDLDYYTQSIQTSKIKIDRVDDPDSSHPEPYPSSHPEPVEGCHQTSHPEPYHPSHPEPVEGCEEREWRGCTLGFGDVTVTTTIAMFKKIKFHSRDSLGFEQLEMPEQSLETVAMWLACPDSIVQAVRDTGRVFAEGMIGIANALVECAPLYVMCDVQDIGVVVDSMNLGKDALFLYDRYPGGMGYAQRCADAIEELMQAVYSVVSQCGCESGCPSCVGAAVPAFAQTDLDSASRGRLPDKEAALVILRGVLG